MKETYQLAVELYQSALASGAPGDQCQCCGAQIEEGVKGCFELFSEVCALAYSNPAYGRSLFYGVDAHALQHPEIHGKKNNAAHLLRLHWVLTAKERPDGGQLPAWWQAYLNREDIPHLEPPRNRGEITVVDVAFADNPEAFAQGMEKWARSVYDAWEAHHAWAAAELARIFGPDDRDR